MSEIPSAPPAYSPSSQMTVPNSQPIGFITQQPQPSSQPPYPSYPYNNQMPIQNTQPVNSTEIILPPQLSSDPITCICPMCRQMIATKVTYKSGTRTHLTAALLCALDDGGCCVLLPYCCNCTKDAHHYCPNEGCGYYFGKHEPSL